MPNNPQFSIRWDCYPGKYSELVTFESNLLNRRRRSSRFHYRRKPGSFFTPVPMQSNELKQQAFWTSRGMWLDLPAPSYWRKSDWRVESQASLHVPMYTARWFRIDCQLKREPMELTSTLSQPAATPIFWRSWMTGPHEDGIWVPLSKWQFASMASPRGLISSNVFPSLMSTIVMSVTGASRAVVGSVLTSTCKVCRGPAMAGFMDWTRSGNSALSVNFL